MTKDIDHILSEFDDEEDKAKDKNTGQSPESLIESAFDDQMLNPDLDLPPGRRDGYSTETSDELYTGDEQSGELPAGEYYEPELPEPAPLNIESSSPEKKIDDIDADEKLPVADDDLLIPPVPGTRSWNTRQPYMLEISKQTLEKDIASLDTSFYFTQNSASREELSSELKRALLMYLKKQFISVAENYREFVNRVLVMEGQELLKYFNIGPEKEKIFMYHLGVTTVFSFICARFKKNGIGYCYRYGKDGKAQRFFPEVFLRQVIADWYQDNIYNLGLQFDSLQIFDSIKNSVSRQYIDVEKEFRSRLEKINLKVEPARRITGDRLMKLKGSEWYDVAIVSAYKRFVGRTIFG